MVRVVRTEDGVKVDPEQRLPGRGAYVHDLAECFELAVKKGGLSRTLRAEVAPGLLTAYAAQAPSRSGNSRGTSKES
jgi:predicted RNA-binding protein YlxR (DUF448 family)